jgi:hypothetical protein
MAKNETPLWLAYRVPLQRLFVRIGVLPFTGPSPHRLLDSVAAIPHEREPNHGRAAGYLSSDRRNGADAGAADGRF